METTERLLSRCSRMDNEIQRDKQIIKELIDENEQLKGSIVYVEKALKVKHESVLRLFKETLNLKEKAEKLDQITLNGTRPVTADWIREQAKLLLDLEQENKKLKEELENTINQLTLRNDSVNNLKEDVERWKKNFDHCHLLLTKEQQKIEEIRNFEEHVLYPTEHDKEIRAILEKKYE